MRYRWIELSPDACAVIDCAVREYRADAAESLEADIITEGEAAALDQTSETYAIGRRLATCDTLIAVLEAAPAIAVALPAAPRDILIVDDIDLAECFATAERTT